MNNLYRSNGLSVGRMLLLGACLLLSIFNVQAMPSFARQTGYSCSECHTQSFGANLTPLGRDFKLSGYTQGDANPNVPALSAMLSGSLTHLQKDADAPPAPGYTTNNNLTLDSAAVFYAGRIMKNVGAFSQLTYKGVEDKLALDNTDIRFADNLDIGDYTVDYGISLNNNPTVQDLWNSTPAWGFPYSGNCAVQPCVGTTALIDGGLSGQVGGGSFYSMLDNTLYLEGGAYVPLAKNIQTGVGVYDPAQNQIDGAAPYWRAALQKNWKGHYFELGHYGMSAKVFPGRDQSSGTDSYTDVAVDATYQYMANPVHIFEAKTTYIYEDQNLSATRLGAAGGALDATGRTYLTTYKINAAYTYEQTYGLTFAYNRTSGTRDLSFYPNYGANRPDSEYYTAELVYVPFGKSTSLMGSLLNLRTSLQYIGYTRFNGDGATAQNNNTFMVNGLLAF
ncbi:MAG: cytochrome C [Methylobacter sp.]|nr:cytochrome C [Methylobacter sp.]